MNDPRRLVGSGLVPEDSSHTELKENGQQKDYVVLSEEERARGYVRPVRHNYIHTGTNPEMSGCVLIKPDKDGCGALTKMATEIAETYARNPKFYTGTFCIGCRKHFPLSQFRWEDGSVVGS